MLFDKKVKTMIKLYDLSFGELDQLMKDVFERVTTYSQEQILCERNEDFHEAQICFELSVGYYVLYSLVKKERDKKICHSKKL